MKITKYLHSCLLVEEHDRRILFDPGKFSFVEGLVDPDVFTDIDAIIITHQHPDHIDEKPLKQIVSNNPQAKLYANSQICLTLADADIDCEVFEDGSRNVGVLSVRAHPAEHAAILADSIPQNVAYIVNNRLLNPGDSFDDSLLEFAGIEILALPIMAPWTTELRVAEFARAMKPKHCIPIHDGFAKDFFVEMRHENFKKFLQRDGIEFHPLLEPGASLRF